MTHNFLSSLSHTFEMFIFPFFRKSLFRAQRRLELQRMRQKRQKCRRRESHFHVASDAQRDRITADSRKHLRSRELFDDDRKSFARKSLSTNHCDSISVTTLRLENGGDEKT